MIDCPSASFLENLRRLAEIDRRVHLVPAQNTVRFLLPNQKNTLGFRQWAICLAPNHKNEGNIWLVGPFCRSLFDRAKKPSME